MFKKFGLSHLTVGEFLEYLQDGWGDSPFLTKRMGEEVRRDVPRHFDGVPIEVTFHVVFPRRYGEGTFYRWTIAGLPPTLEEKMKGWRLASPQNVFVIGFGEDLGGIYAK